MVLQFVGCRMVDQEPGAACVRQPTLLQLQVCCMMDSSAEDRLAEYQCQRLAQHVMLAGY